MDDQLTSTQRRWRIAWHVLFTLLQLICLGTLVRWHPYEHLPPPGYAVSCIALAAAAMSIHEGMRVWQKVAWMILIGILLRTELRAIAKDRADSDTRALVARKEQDTAFKQVRDAQNAAFKSTAGGIASALSGISSTLDAAKITILQTRSHAAVQYLDFDFVGDGQIRALQPNMTYEVNVGYINRGLEAARDVKVLTAVKIAPPDSAIEQRMLVLDFEKAWKKQVLASSRIDEPYVRMFRTTAFSISKDELTRLNTQTAVLYYLVRIEYTDSTGTWRNDNCRNFQSGTGILGGVTHLCYVFNRDRYKVAGKSSAREDNYNDRPSHPGRRE